MSAKNKIDIFLVDDDKLFLVALKSYIEANFKNEGVKIHTFFSGEECMVKFVQIMPEIVILDYHLNGRNSGSADGIKILDLIKKEEINTSVIIVTNEDHLDIALESFHHGAADYVVKTETRFKKINYSLTHLFKLRESKKKARRYKTAIYILSLIITFLIGGFVTFWMLSLRNK
jgi:DNA-binding NtrC family response regulator